MNTATTHNKTENRSAEQSRSKLVPALRFKEFNGIWKSNKMEDVANKITSGSRDWAQYYSDNGDKFIRMTNLPKNGINLLLDDLKYVKLPEESSEGKRTSLDGGDILISITAELGKIGWVPNNLGLAYINQHTALVKLTTKVNSKYVAYQLSTNRNNNKLNRLNDSGAKSGLNLSTIRTFKIPFPSLPEQQKTASFLSVVDEKIRELTKKKTLLEQYKKGVMQQLFSGQLRFKDENGKPYPDWEEKRLGETIKEVVDKSTSSNQYPILSSTKNDIYLQSEYFTRDIASADNTGYKILKMNQLVFSPQNLWLGNININTKFEIGIVSPSYKIFNFKKDVAIVIFFKDFLQTNRMMYEYAQASEQGASVVRRNLDMPSFKAIKIKLPCLEEQQKIATYLSSIDTKIEAVIHQITQTQTFKKGLLQHMFV